MPGREQLFQSAFLGGLRMRGWSFTPRRSVVGAFPISTELTILSSHLMLGGRAMLKLCRLVIGSLVVFSLGVVVGAENEKPRTAGEILKAISELKSKNLQRTNRFLHFEGQVERIQLAFVMDGTESMTEEFASLRKNLDVFADQLLKTCGNGATELRMTAVVYRDTGAAHPIQMVSTDFLTVDEFKLKFDEMKIETGEPFYQERVDEGLYEAIEKLDWAPLATKNSARWIVLCGDAPPYTEDSGDDFRKYTTQKLVSLANAKGVSVYGICCASGFGGQNARNAQLMQVAAEYRPDMIRFMKDVSSGTGGSYTDMSDSDSIRRMIDPQFKVRREIGTISQRDIDSARQNSGINTNEPSVRVAVLPHGKFEELTWFVKKEEGDQPHPEVLVATEMKQFLPHLGRDGLAIVGDSAEVKAIIQRLVKEMPKKGDDEYLTRIARAVDADYIVWGKYETGSDESILTTGIYSGQNGKLLVQGPKSSVRSTHEFALRDQVQQSLRKLSQYVTDPALFANPKDARAFTKGIGVPESKALVTPIASDLRAQRSMLAGLEMLEQSLAYLKPAYAQDAESAQLSADLMRNALGQFEVAIAHEPENPIAHLWIASCHYNLAEKGGHASNLKPFSDHLQKAYDYRSATVIGLKEEKVPLLDESRSKEVEAYYALFNNQHSEAVKAFTELTNVKGSVRGNVALRAHWMLAGIRLGDWDVAAISPKLRDAVEARQHILAIMANWEGTPEERFYKTCVFGDSQKSPQSFIELTRNFGPNR